MDAYLFAEMLAALKVLCDLVNCLFHIVQHLLLAACIQILIFREHLIARVEDALIPLDLREPDALDDPRHQCDAGLPFHHAVDCEERALGVKVRGQQFIPLFFIFQRHCQVDLPFFLESCKQALLGPSQTKCRICPRQEQDTGNRQDRRFMLSPIFHIHAFFLSRC